ncbi:helix-turn-helix transcriptional regulator [Listeria booriae]|uniref:Helix-turn-helix transcriptional regulator n=1 Tax=Listeria booriae TaxID=1552123 RepID=A0A842AFM5_9LIST|nr:helix-turn-helix transcriptional regulator [Listeria booriae]MBC1615362.1 helix-turn-helix transcriptional regulator [Listeria booriae]
MINEKIPAYAKQTLKSLRVRSGYSQSEAAESLGITAITLRKLEKDSSDITYDMMNKTSQLYVCPIDYIFFGNNTAFSVMLEKEKECV